MTRSAIVCDRCGKEIPTTEVPGGYNADPVLRLTEGADIRITKHMGADMVDKKVDLCESCTHMLYKLLFHRGELK